MKAIKSQIVTLIDEEITMEVTITDGDGVSITDTDTGAEVHVGSYADEIDRAIAMLSAAKDYLTAVGTEAL